MNKHNMNQLFIGLMSGTSVDAVDAVVIDLSKTPHKILASLSYPIPLDLAKQIHQYYKSPNSSLQHIGESHVAVGQLFAEAALELLKRSELEPKDIAAIGSHGQTIFHHPTGPYPFSLQLGDPNVIAARTGITTVANFRNKDLALGGQGAPLAPFYHEAIFRVPNKNRAIINIGGIANITLLPGDLNAAISGYDIGPGNTLLDRWSEQHLQQFYDQNGLYAQTGLILPQLLNLLLDDSYFKRPTPKSTGREYFNLGWLEQSLTGLELPQDVMRTLVELTAKSIANAVNNSQLNDLDIVVCGGGVHNTYLMERLSENCAPWPVLSSKELGVEPNWVEAMAFAWFAQQSLERNAMNLGSVTGASKPSVLGNIVFS